MKKEVTVKANKTGYYQEPGGEYRSGFETRFSIERSDFGMAYLALVSDKVELNVSVEGVRVENKASSSGGLDVAFRLGCE